MMKLETRWTLAWWMGLALMGVGTWVLVRRGLLAGPLEALDWFVRGGGHSAPCGRGCAFLAGVAILGYVLMLLGLAGGLLTEFAKSRQRGER